MKILSNGLAIIEGDCASKIIEKKGILNVDDKLINLIKDYIPIGGTVVDVGACFGVHTITYSRLVGSSGHVHVFEPNPIVFECLQHNLKNCKNTILYQKALLDKLSVGNIQKGGRGYENNIGASRFIETDSGSVSSLPLDSLKFNRLDFIKIDAEGSELKILRGAVDTITKFKPIILIEINNPQLIASGCVKEEVLDFLSELGYDVKPIYVDYNKEEYNAICLPRDKFKVSFKEGNKKMRFHVLGLPQIDTNREFYLCGFTQKIVNFCRILKELGHTVILYTGEHNTAPCDEAVCVITDKERSNWLGDIHYVFAAFDLRYAMWAETNKRMIIEIAKRKQLHDFICHVGGLTQKPVTSAHSDCMGVEFGVGYPGIAEKFIVFESHSWRQYCYGCQDTNKEHFYDTTIPGYFDVKDFPFGDGKGDFLLYVGRMTLRKGMNVIEAIAKATKLLVKMIGPGGPPPIKGCEYIGTVSIKERAKLMGAARAILIPTVYNEPFGSVVVEAQLCGTPVITTDYGSFPELVRNGVNGYRCNLLRDFVKATEDVKKLDRAKIRTEAIAKYSIEAVKPQYQAYFERLNTLWGKGWYA